MGLERLHGLAIEGLRLVFGDAEHLRLRRAIDVGIQDPHPGALGRECKREIDRRGALAHAALARSHGDDVLHPRHQLHALLHRVRHDVAADLEREFRNLRQRGIQLPGDELAQHPELASRRITQLDIKGHPRSVHLEVSHDA